MQFLLYLAKGDKEISLLLCHYFSLKMQKSKYRIILFIQLSSTQCLRRKANFVRKNVNGKTRVRKSFSIILFMHPKKVCQVCLPLITLFVCIDFINTQHFHFEYIVLLLHKMKAAYPTIFSCIFSFCNSNIVLVVNKIPENYIWYTCC